MIRQWEYKPHKKSNKKKKKIERQRENLLVWGKNMHRMRESDKFIVRE